MAQTRQKLMIVGNGMAAGRLMDELIKRGTDDFDLTVIGDEPEGSYNRIMLSPVLAGDTQVDDIIGKPARWYADRGITFLGGVRVESIERRDKCVITTCGKRLDYDYLVLAVGSRPARIPARNQQLGNIFSFRTLVDVDRILSAASEALEEPRQTDTDAVVVGGGLLGLEAAYGLALKGLRVTLVHRSGWLMNRQLDPQAGKLLKQVMATERIQFRLSDEVNEFVGGRRLESASLKNSGSLTCKLAVIATGITPNAELGLEAGLKGGRGIAVDAYMNTSDSHISAIGECTEFEGATFGLVDPIWQHCVTLADRLCLGQFTPFANKPTPTKLKVSGVNLFSAGEFLTEPRHRELLYEDLSAGIYRKILLENNRIVGVVLFGDTRDGPDYFSMLTEQTDVSEIAPFLLMGKAFYGSIESDNSEAA